MTVDCPVRESGAAAGMLCLADGTGAGPFPGGPWEVGRSYEDSSDRAITSS